MRNRCATTWRSDGDCADGLPSDRCVRSNRSTSGPSTQSRLMASIQKDSRSGRYHILFRYGRRQYRRSLNTSHQREALAVCGRVEETLTLLQRERLEMPDDADPALFILSDGKLSTKPLVERKRTLGDRTLLRPDQTLPPHRHSRREETRQLRRLPLTRRPRHRTDLNVRTACYSVENGCFGGVRLVQAVRTWAVFVGRKIENRCERIAVEGCDRLRGPARAFTAVERRDHSIAN